MTPSLILINPWIYDFAAFDLWSKPLGLLQLASQLRQRGFKVHLVDCMDVDHPAMHKHPHLKPPHRGPYGTGKFWREIIPPPPPLKKADRPYSRYGISPEAFEQSLKEIKRPGAILVTSLMTYWYPGVQEAIRRARKIHPKIPVILGGIYARLCTHHAVTHSGADQVVSEQGLSALLRVLKQYGIPEPLKEARQTFQNYPAFDLLRKIRYTCIMTSTGCPYCCRYCASHFLFPRFEQKDPDEILAEILYWHKDWGIQDMAFYDDALLVSSDTHLRIVLEQIANRNLTLRFHTPNAMHVREITKPLAELLFKTGFHTLRLGLEVSDDIASWDLDHKRSAGDFAHAMACLREAGFPAHRIGAYILMGLPDQTPESVAQTIRFADQHGCMPYLSEYSPIPHTHLWEEAISASVLDIESEPLFHNNSLLPCWDSSKKEQIPKLRQMVLKVRQKLRSNS